MAWLAALALLSACTTDESARPSTPHPVIASMPDKPHDAPTPGTWSTPGQRLPHAQAAERFDLRKRLPYYDSAYYDGHRAQLQVVDGDLHVAGNLLLDWAHVDTFGLFVSGDLVVDGSILNSNMDGGPFLIVGGRTRAHSIVGGGTQLVFEGDTQVDTLVLGHYNGGVLLFRQALSAPAVVNMDHHLDIRGPLSGQWYDVFDSDHWPHILAPDMPDMALLESDVWRWLDHVLFPALAERRQVVRDNLPPSQSQYPP